MKSEFELECLSRGHHSKSCECMFICVLLVLLGLSIPYSFALQEYNSRPILRHMSPDSVTHALEVRSLCAALHARAKSSYSPLSCIVGTYTISTDYYSCTPPNFAHCTASVWMHYSDPSTDSAIRCAVQINHIPARIPIPELDLAALVSSPRAVCMSLPRDEE